MNLFVKFLEGFLRIMRSQLGTLLKIKENRWRDWTPSGFFLLPLLHRCVSGSGKNTVGRQQGFLDLFCA